MKGLALSERYYIECGREVFRRRFGSLMDRIAAGLAGPGSECFGFDDQYSRDHDWGPGFCLWVPREEYQRYGRELQACYDGLPKEFDGFGPRRTSAGEGGRVGVIELEGFFKRYTGLDHPPRTIDEWNISSANLALCVNGKVFSDPLGRFTGWRNRLLEFYPRDLMLKKLADTCMRAGQAGQYNWQRGLVRKDPFVMQTAKTDCCREALKMTFLLNRTYAPYYKWLFAGAGQLPFLGKEVCESVRKILSADEIGGRDDWQDVQHLLGTLCATLIRGLQEKAFTDETVPFLVDHVPSILGKIADPAFKGRQWTPETKDRKNGIIGTILEKEWGMFAAVNDRAAQDPSNKNRPSCRDFPDEFRLHRTAQLTAWSENTLAAYLDDLVEAEQSGKNLMTYKYARMEGLIPKENHSPHIDRIAGIMVDWQREFIRSYPRIMSGGRPLTRDQGRNQGGGQDRNPGGNQGGLVSFETYLRGELETYSEKTLASLYGDVQDYQRRGKTFPEEIYTFLAREKGYASIAQAEAGKPEIIGGG